MTRAGFQRVRTGTATAVACLVLLSGSGRTQPRPLPDPDAFLAQTRARLDRNEDRLAGYVYRETQRRTTLDGDGHPREETVRVVESYPGLPGEARWERVLEEGGQRVPDADLQRADNERRKKAEAVARRLANQSDRDKRDAAEAAAKRRREARERVDDVFLVYDIRMLGRETLDGHDTIAFAFEPRVNAAPRTREGKWLRSFKGRAWISEADHELVRLDAEAIGDVSVGMGLLARIQRGTTASFTRRKVDAERWLPASASYTVNGRVLLLKRLRERGTTEYSEYRRFAVDAASSSATIADGASDGLNRTDGSGRVTR